MRTSAFKLPLISTLALLTLFFSCQSDNKESAAETQSSTANYTSNDYQDLVALFKEWRTFENPPLLDGAPDYTAETFEKRWPRFKELQKSLKAIDTANWPVENKVDWMIVWAEMNGYDFNHRILKPWVRDPAYYKSVWTYRSDVPAHEGPTHHGTTELWTYSFPLSSEERQRLLNDLKVIAPLNVQAKKNLTGNARDLWVAGIRDIENQSTNLEKWIEFHEAIVLNQPGTLPEDNIQAGAVSVANMKGEHHTYYWDENGGPKFDKNPSRANR